MLVWKQSPNNTFNTRNCATDWSRVYRWTNTRVHGCKCRNNCCRGTSRRGLFLNSIVATDETWVNYFTPESKRSSIQWRYPGSPEPKKAKTTFSVGKVMTTIFWDPKGVFQLDFLTQLRTINSEYYSALLEGPVKTVIRNKRKRTQTSVSFIQDNARPHVATRTMDTIQKLKWNFLPQTPYSPDIAPSDYHLFGSLKEHLGGKRFRNNEEVIQDVQAWLY